MNECGWMNMSGAGNCACVKQCARRCLSVSEFVCVNESNCANMCVGRSLYVCKCVCVNEYRFVNLCSRGCLNV